MGQQRVHAVVGSGTASKKAIVAALNDIIEDGDAVSLVWETPHNETQEDVFDYILSGDRQFTMYYAEGNNPHKLFKEAENGVVQKVRNPHKSALQSVANGGAVLILWDDDENPADDPENSLAAFIFDTCGDDQLVLELTNGLAPVKAQPDVEIPDVEVPIEVEKEEDEPVFSKAELQNMTAGAVKIYGHAHGATATTKTAIIDELFPPEEDKAAAGATGDVDEAEQHRAAREAIVASAKTGTDTGNVSNFGTVPMELRHFATAALRLANAIEASTKGE